jgi:excinuclease ABC subunit C
MKEMGLSQISLIGLAKRNEEIFLPGVDGPVVLPRRSPGLKLLQRIRDEAHRFAVEYHRKLRGRGMVRSDMDGIPGVGRYRKVQLLVSFGSLKGLRKATEDEIAAVPGIGPATAKKIHEYIHSK